MGSWGHCTKMSKNRPVLCRVSRSGFDDQSLSFKGLTKKNDFQPNTADFCSFLVKFFGAVHIVLQISETADFLLYRKEILNERSSQINDISQ